MISDIIMISEILIKVKQLKNLYNIQKNELKNLECSDKIPGFFSYLKNRNVLGEKIREIEQENLNTLDNIMLSNNYQIIDTNNDGVTDFYIDSENNSEPLKQINPFELIKPEDFKSKFETLKYVWEKYHSN